MKAASSEHDAGTTPIRRRRKSLTGTLDVPLAYTAHGRITPPCGECHYPMVVSDGGRCPKCAAGPDWTVTL